MPIHSFNHSLTSYTTVVVVLLLLLLLQTSTPIIKALAENSHVINFQSPHLYPESLAWDPSKQHFLVGSLRHRTISSISDAGIIETLISDSSLPENVTVVGITVDSRNNRVLAVIHAVKPLPPFNALAAYDLKSGNRLFLSPLPTDEEALANDVAVDYNGNAYVTNSIGNYIWKVNVKGEASIFSKLPRFTEHPVDRDTPYSYIGLNGIAYVSSGDYLLVVQSNTGKVFKVDADDGTARQVLLNEDLTRPAGVVFRSDGVVLVVSPQANKLWLLKSNNGWGEGVVYDKIDLESEGYPTSVVSRGRDKMYVLYGYFLEGLLGNLEREGFRIEEIMSPKESEGENVWLYVMIGFGMMYFVYWRFQMGQLVYRIIGVTIITVLIGETGSGKSTQIVQFLADSGIGADGSIVCTQPRKIAAKSLAQRVQEESSGCYEENSIQCVSTFSSSQKFDSRISFMTDHCLLQRYMTDRNLSGVSCIIVDEAHERSLNTDLLLALIKNLLCKRVDLRLIIMSATADAKQLSDYFYGCGVFHVHGRNFPVEMRYVPSNYADHSGPAAVESYVVDVVRMATEIHKTEKEGTILAFLTSQVEVEWACEKFKVPSAVALPLHGKLTSEEQFHVFQNYPGKRKVIFSTNLAETSITIPGVKYVIDSGLFKDCRFDPCTGMNVLKVCWISQSSANQRAGRAGRTEPGRCYRMYSEADYNSMELNQEPEIRRVHLGVAVL
ncbi:hypothetical protein KIW84_050821 [Lathyrus oleraceus]|uniref:RNA helicase n=1 Tax=Pisum sativum TaxID=3888 RepID=A0A9D4WMB4_PEA|nr:hypothetical protein KIW84_050821 [Pisum sativum]